MLDAMTPPWPARYELLDGLRGLACLAVLLHHLGIAPIGHYAVMVFFVISGYCITASAQAFLRRGLPFGDYLARRARRIYPPYFFAIALFAVSRIMKAFLQGTPYWQPSLLEWIQNLTLTQWVSDLFTHIAWPADNRTLFVSAFWSLNYEEQFYLVIGLALVLAAKYRFGLLPSVVALTMIGLAWNLTFPDGWVTGFFIEYWPNFALGSILYFVLCESAFTWARAPFLVASAFLGLVCAAHFLSWHQSATLETAGRVYGELLLLSGLAIALVLIRPASDRISSSLLWQPVAAIGTISYSLYLIHQFNLTLVAAAANLLVPINAPTPLLVMTQVILHLMLAAVFWYWCERPFLSRRTVALRPSVAVDAEMQPPARD